jgi:hypothetical protein
LTYTFETLARALAGAERGGERVSEITSAPKATRRSKERRAIVVVNLVLLGIAAVVAAPGSVKAVVSGIEEESECAKARAIFASNDVRTLEQSSGIDLENAAAFVALDKLAQAVDAAHFEALHLQSLVSTCKDLGAARTELLAAEQNAAAVKTMMHDLEQRAEAQVALLQKFAALCMSDPAAQADCVALSTLPPGSIGPTTTTAALEERLGELETQHDALAALTIHVAPMKALVATQLQEQQDLIVVMHDYVGKLKALEHDATDEDALRRRVRRDEMKLKQQLVGVRLYCDAPVETPAGGKP